MKTSLLCILFTLIFPQVLREELQLIVDQSKDRDLACHICVFGLMGHGKSRFLNLMLTAVTQNGGADQASYHFSPLVLLLFLLENNLHSSTSI